MKDNLWMCCSFLSPGESLGALMIPLSFDKNYFCIYMCCIEHTQEYTRFCLSTRPLITQSLVHICTNCLMLLISVTRLWKYSLSAWIGISRLASQAFQSQRCLNCSRKRLIFLTSFRKTSLIRLRKRPSGILKRHTAFCIRSAKLCCGETRITPRVKHQRYVQTCMYTFKLCMYMV